MSSLRMKKIPAIEVCVEMDIYTKHLTEWIPIDMIDEYGDSPLFNGIEIYSLRLGSFYLHDTSAENFKKDLEFIKKYSQTVEARS